METDRTTDLPAALFNAALAHLETRASRGEFVTFALANQPWLAANYQWLAEAGGALGPQRAYYLSFPEMLGDYPFLPTKALLHGWQQYRPWLALTGLAVPRELACRNKDFDESPVLQTTCDWEWLLRLSKIAEIRHVGEYVGPATATPLENYPLRRRFRPSRDLQQRYVVRAKEPTLGAARGARRHGARNPSSRRAAGRRRLPAAPRGLPGARCQAPGVRTRLPPDT